MSPAAFESPLLVGRPGGPCLVLAPDGNRLPRIVWWGVLPAGAAVADVVGDVVATVGPAGVALSNEASHGRAVPLLAEASTSWNGRPGLAGYRLGSDVGGDWSTAFGVESVDADDTAVRVEARDDQAGLALRTDVATVPGGSLRMRHTVTNAGTEPYVVEALEVAVPLPDRVGEILDLTGRWGREREPQRHPLADGLWVRESRGGRPGPDSATELLVGVAGFGFGAGEVWGVHVAWSGNARYTVERLPSGIVTTGGGELLLPGEIVLAPGESYASPWVFLAASTHGMDGVAAQRHAYVRSLPNHPAEPRPVTGNVWEAVYFDHDLVRLRGLADLAAEVGIERFVLDDGWFGARRDDHAGLGDWTVSSDVWPHGLRPIVEYVRGLGMQFGLWFEPEMVNPDSDLYRAHPEWVLAASGREPVQLRNQLVLDLGRAEVRDHLFAAISAVLGAEDISYVKWDHNRDLVEAASRAHGDAPGAHAQTLGFYDLLDRLRAAHPDVEWESCASGGSRVDLAVLERVERVWTSDMTDALARQQIQRWTGQLVPPEYLGAHVSATRNHQTGRVLDLAFRAATAFFGDFGVEWDLSAATAQERDELAGWIAAYKQHRTLLHTGAVVRVDSSDPVIRVNGVVGTDLAQAVFGYVQTDETVRDPLPWLVPGLDPARRYRCTSIDPGGRAPEWRGDGLVLSGAVLATVGLPAPPRRPESARLVLLEAE